MKKILKSKIGFTLVELMVVVVIMGILLAIGIPAYRSVGKTSRIKACNVNQRELVNQANDYCVDTNYNGDITYSIIADLDNGKAIIGDANGNVEKDTGTINVLKNDVHCGNPLYCPAGGVITITVKKGAVYPVITAKCNGGTDGDCHKPEDQTETQTEAQTEG